MFKMTIHSAETLLYVVAVVVVFCYVAFIAYLLWEAFVNGHVKHLISAITGKFKHVDTSDDMVTEEYLSLYENLDDLIEELGNIEKKVQKVYWHLQRDGVTKPKDERRLLNVIHTCGYIRTTIEVMTSRLDAMKSVVGVSPLYPEAVKDKELEMKYANVIKEEK